MPSAGEILLNGQPIAGLTPHAINRRGLSRSFQITNLFPAPERGREPAHLGDGPAHHRFTLFRPISRLARVTAEVDEYLEKLRLDPRRDDPAGALAYSEQRTLEIGMALATDPRSCCWTSRPAGMSREESAYMVALIRTVTEGKTLLVVEHDMNVVFTLCDQHLGAGLWRDHRERAPRAVRANREVQEAYLGEEVA